MNVQSKAMSVQVVDLKTHNYLLFFLSFCNFTHFHSILSESGKLSSIKTIACT